MSVYTACGPAGHVRPLHQPMNKRPLLLRLVHQVRPAWVALLAVWVLAAHQTRGTEIWNGPAINFTNAVGSDPTDPASQDRLTFNVWLTRGSTHGLYNAAVETSYSSLSPVGTEWAYGALADYASLNLPRPGWLGTGRTLPPWWGKTRSYISYPTTFIWPFDSPPGISAPDGFSYTRSTPPVPEPSASLMLLLGTAALTGVRFCSRRPRSCAGAEH